MNAMPWFNFSKYNATHAATTRAFSVNHPQAGRLIVFKDVSPSVNDQMTQGGFTRTADGSWVVAAKGFKNSQIATIFPGTTLSMTDFATVDLTQQFLSRPAPSTTPTVTKIQSPDPTLSETPVDTSRGPDEAIDVNAIFDSMPKKKAPVSIGANPLIRYFDNNGQSQNNVTRYTGLVPASFEGSLWSYLEKYSEVVVKESGDKVYTLTTEEKTYQIHRPAFRASIKPVIDFYSSGDPSLLPKIVINTTPSLFLLTDKITQQLGANAQWHIATDGEEALTNLTKGAALVPSLTYAQFAAGERVGDGDDIVSISSFPIEHGNVLVLGNDGLNNQVSLNDLKAVFTDQHTQLDSIVNQLPPTIKVTTTIEGAQDTVIRSDYLVANPEFVELMSDAGYKGAIVFDRLTLPETFTVEDNVLLTDDQFSLELLVIDPSLAPLAPTHSVVRNPAKIPPGYILNEGKSRYANKVNMVHESSGVKLCTHPHDLQHGENTTWFSDPYAAVAAVSENESAWEAQALLNEKNKALIERIRSGDFVSDDSLVSLVDKELLTSKEATALVKHTFNMKPKAAREAVSSQDSETIDSVVMYRAFPLLVSVKNFLASDGPVVEVDIPVFSSLPSEPISSPQPQVAATVITEKDDTVYEGLDDDTLSSTYPEVFEPSHMVDETKITIMGNGYLMRVEQSEGVFGYIDDFKNYYRDDTPVRELTPAEQDAVYGGGNDVGLASGEAEPSITGQTSISDSPPVISDPVAAKDRQRVEQALSVVLTLQEKMKNKVDRFIDPLVPRLETLVDDMRNTLSTGEDLLDVPSTLEESIEGLELSVLKLRTLDEDDALNNKASSLVSERTERFKVQGNLVTTFVSIADSPWICNNHQILDLLSRGIDLNSALLDKVNIERARIVEQGVYDTSMSTYHYGVTYDKDFIAQSSEYVTKKLADLTQSSGTEISVTPEDKQFIINYEKEYTLAVSNLVQLNQFMEKASISGLLQDGHTVVDQYGARYWLSPTRENDIAVGNILPFESSNKTEVVGVSVQSVVDQLFDALSFNLSLLFEKEEREASRENAREAESKIAADAEKDDNPTDDLFGSVEGDPAPAADENISDSFLFGKPAVYLSRDPKGNMLVTGPGVSVARDDVEAVGARYLKTKQLFIVKKDGEQKTRRALSLLEGSGSVNVIDNIRLPLDLKIGAVFSHQGKLHNIENIDYLDYRAPPFISVECRVGNENDYIQKIMNTSLHSMEQTYDLTITNMADVLEDYTPSSEPVIASVESTNTPTDELPTPVSVVAGPASVPVSPVSGEPPRAKVIAGDVAEFMGMNNAGNAIYQDVKSDKRFAVNTDGTFSVEALGFNSDTKEFLPVADRNEIFSTLTESVSSSKSENVVSIFSTSPKNTTSESDTASERGKNALGSLSSDDRAELDTLTESVRRKHMALHYSEKEGANDFVVRSKENDFTRALDSLNTHLSAVSFKTLSRTEFDLLLHRMSESSETLSALQSSINDKKMMSVFDYSDAASLIRISKEMVSCISVDQMKTFLELNEKRNFLLPNIVLLAKYYGSDEEERKAIALVEKNTNEEVLSFFTELNDKYASQRELVEQVADIDSYVAKFTDSTITGYGYDQYMSLIDRYSTQNFPVDGIDITPDIIEGMKATTSPDEAWAWAEKVTGLPQHSAKLFCEAVDVKIRSLHRLALKSTPEYLHSKHVAENLINLPIKGNHGITDLTLEEDSTDVMVSIETGRGNITISALTPYDKKSYVNNTENAQYQMNMTFNPTHSGTRLDDERLTMYYTDLPSLEKVRAEIDCFSQQYMTKIGQHSAPAIGELEGKVDVFTPSIASTIRNDIKLDIAAGELPKGIKMSVTKGSSAPSVNVSVKELPADFQLYSVAYAKWYADQKERQWPQDVDSPNLFSPEGQALHNRLTRLMDAYNYNRSDYQSDYHDVGYYSSLDTQTIKESDVVRLAALPDEEAQRLLYEREFLTQLPEDGRDRAKYQIMFFDGVYSDDLSRYAKVFSRDNGRAATLLIHDGDTIIQHDGGARSIYHAASQAVSWISTGDAEQLQKIALTANDAMTNSVPVEDEVAGTQNTPVTPTLRSPLNFSVVHVGDAGSSSITSESVMKHFVDNIAPPAPAIVLPIVDIDQVKPLEQSTIPVQEGALIEALRNTFRPYTSFKLSSIPGHPSVGHAIAIDTRNKGECAVFIDVENNDADNVLLRAKNYGNTALALIGLGNQLEVLGKPVLEGDYAVDKASYKYCLRNLEIFSQDTFVSEYLTGDERDAIDRDVGEYYQSMSPPFISEHVDTHNKIVQEFTMFDHQTRTFMSADQYRDGHWQMGGWGHIRGDGSLSGQLDDNGLTHSSTLALTLDNFGLNHSVPIEGGMIERSAIEQKALFMPLVEPDLSPLRISTLERSIFNESRSVDNVLGRTIQFNRLFENASNLSTKAIDGNWSLGHYINASGFHDGTPVFAMDVSHIASSTGESVNNIIVDATEDLTPQEIYVNLGEALDRELDSVFTSNNPVGLSTAMHALRDIEKLSERHFVSQLINDDDRVAIDTDVHQFYASLRNSDIDSAISEPEDFVNQWTTTFPTYTSAVTLAEHANGQWSATVAQTYVPQEHVCKHSGSIFYDDATDLFTDALIRDHIHKDDLEQLTAFCASSGISLDRDRLVTQVMHDALTESTKVSPVDSSGSSELSSLTLEHIVVTSTVSDTILHMVKFPDGLTRDASTEFLEKASAFGGTKYTNGTLPDGIYFDAEESINALSTSLTSTLVQSSDETTDVSPSLQDDTSSLPFTFIAAAEGAGFVRSLENPNAFAFMTMKGDAGRVSFYPEAGSENVKGSFRFNSKPTGRVKASIEGLTTESTSQDIQKLISDTLSAHSNTPLYPINNDQMDDEYCSEEIAVWLATDMDIEKTDTGYIVSGDTYQYKSLLRALGGQYHKKSGEFSSPHWTFTQPPLRPAALMLSSMFEERGLVKIKEGDFTVKYGYDNGSFVILGSSLDDPKPQVLTRTPNLLSLRTEYIQLMVEGIDHRLSLNTIDSGAIQHGNSTTRSGSSREPLASPSTGITEGRTGRVAGEPDNRGTGSLSAESGITDVLSDGSDSRLNDVTTEQRLHEERRTGTQNQEPGEDSGIRNHSPALNEPRQLEQFDLREALATREYSDNARAKSTTEAVLLAATLVDEPRQLTSDEQKTLSHFSGLGAGSFHKGDESIFSGWGRNTQNFGLRNAISKNLTIEQSASIKDTILTGFFTPDEVATFMWDALIKMGVDTQQPHHIFDPAFGTGNFTGFAPAGIRSNSHITAVEKDIVTATIGKHLYPEVKVINRALEDTKMPGNTQDIVIGNPPYGNFRVHDPITNNRKLIHDYFLSEGVRTLKPGGILSYVTSAGTLDKVSDITRRDIYAKADLISAFRLPNNAFKREADTSVVTDILFFRKRKENEPALNGEWVNSVVTSLPNQRDDDTDINVNQYFISNPEHVLGEMFVGTNQYGATIDVKPEGVLLKERLIAMLPSIPNGIFTPTSDIDLDNNSEEKAKRFHADIPSDILESAKVGSIVMLNNSPHTLAFTLGDNEYYGKPMRLAKNAFPIVRDFTLLRDIATRLLKAEAAPLSDDSELFINKQRHRLNEVYDRFTADHGCVSQTSVRKLCKTDPDYFLISALEHYNKSTNSATKAQIFKDRVVLHSVEPTIGNHYDALVASVSRFGHIDLNLAAEWAGCTVDELMAAEGDKIYQDPNSGQHLLPQQYLSGDLGIKLDAAVAAAEFDTRFERNIDAINKAMPSEIAISEIRIKIGATWLPTSLYTDYVREKLSVDKYEHSKCFVTHISETNAWKIRATEKVKSDANSAQHIEWGTHAVPFTKIFQTCLEQNRPKVTRKEDDRTVVDHEQTALARSKQKMVETDFHSWIVKDPIRSKTAVDGYNKLFNRWVEPTFDGTLLSYPNIASTLKGRPFAFRKHQPPAIERALLSEYGTLLAHEAGAGKTMEMVSIAIKGKQMGVCACPLTAVPNHMLVQFTNETLELYPSSRVLAITKDDMKPGNRQAFASKMITNDWDSVICTHSTYKQLAMSADFVEQYMGIELDNYRAALVHAKTDGDSISEKELQRQVNNYEAKIKSQVSALRKKQDTGAISFDDLPIDWIQYDEAHFLKNYAFPTKLSSLAGVNSATSARALDSMMKFDYIRDKRGDNKGVVLATGTPIANSVGELYVMVRYLAPALLKKANIENFDSFIAAFGEVRSSLEMKPDGNGYQMKERLSKFHNVPELLRLFRLVADVKTGDDLDVTRPDAAAVFTTAEQSEDMKSFMSWLAARTAICASGQQKPEIDNRLLIANHGRLASIDLRLISPTLPDAPDSKVNLCVNTVFSKWEEHKEDKRTQLVFLDKGVPGGTSFNLYDDMKQKWIDKGIPEDEIAFIHDAKTDDEKEVLFDRMRSGSIRVMIASTDKMGVGTNVQDLASDLHNLDIPWRSIDLEQRNKRFHRQGCLFNEINLHYYTTKDSFDLFMLNTVDRKHKMFIQAMGDPNKAARQIEEDCDPTYADLQGITTGSEDIKRKVEVDALVEELTMELNAHKYYQGSVAGRIKELGWILDAKHNESKLAQLSVDKASHNPNDPFSITIDGQLFTKHGKAGTALIIAASKMSAYQPTCVIGEYLGFPLGVKRDGLNIKDGYTLFVDAPWQIEQRLTENQANNISQLERKMKAIFTTNDLVGTEISSISEEIKDFKEKMNGAFPGQGELDAALEKQVELNILVQSELDKIEGNPSDLTEHPFAIKINYAETLSDRVEKKMFKLMKPTEILTKEAIDSIAAKAQAMNDSELSEIDKLGNDMTNDDSYEVVPQNEM
jgi:N12 class adenine-specific DNA methylase